MNSVIEALTIKRTYNHPREMVYRAWTEPRRLEKWFCPNPKNKVEAEIDLRVGGRYRFAMTSTSGDAWVVGGEYREIAPPQKLAFTWKWETESSGSLVTVEFHQVEAGTEVVLTHDALESEESRTNHGEGWNATMDRLYEYLTDPMEALMSTAPNLVSAAAQIRQAKQIAAMSLSRIKDTFAHVPDDKLHWTPGGPSKTSLLIVGHAAFANLYFASVLRGDPQLDKSVADVGASIDENAKTVTTREQADELLERATQEVLESYEKLDPVRLTTDPRVGFILTLVGRHVDGHAAQIDYLQTIWGDLEDHFGM